jgi:uncharacterized protein
MAILGILLMNIPGFSMAVPSGWDPSVLNEAGTINFKLWHFIDWFPEGTQRAIFSMLFGAGIILFMKRQEQKLEGVKPLEFFLRRQIWLMVFGLFDAWVLLWWGDILFDYACYGMIMVVFRNLPVKSLLIGALVCFLLMVARDNRDFYLEKRTITRGEAVAAIDTTKVKLTDKQKAQLEAMTSFKEKQSHAKKVERNEKTKKQMTGSYEELYEYRTNNYMNALIHYLYMSIWDVLFFMFLGMAFLKSGIMTGEAPVKYYWIMAVAGLGLGLLLSYYRIKPMISYQFNQFEYVKHVQFESYTISRALRSLGIFGTVMLLFKSGVFNWLFALLRPVGQMAFTNYLTQSLICGIIFYGVGFGYYGSLQRYEVYLVVLAIWVVQIIWSHIWLRFFRFGPLEWCWRSLTYWKKQPMRKANTKEVLSV